MPRFYIDLELKSGSSIIAPDSVARHLWVLRLRIGDEVVLFNGRGGSYLGSIAEIARKDIKIDIIKYLTDNINQTHGIDLGLCIIANDKMDLALQKAVELGVRSITPLISSRSHRLASDKYAKRLEHWQKIIISSCEQSGQNYLPQIHLPLKLEQFIATANAYSLKIILSPYASQAILPAAKPSEAMILVGPEGGFSVEEVDLAIAAGFLTHTLGNLILRTETAVIAGLCYLNIKLGNW